MITLLESLTQPPVELTFGTSGLRGLVSAMTDLECYINTRGFLAFLDTQDQLASGENVYVGIDLRDSSPRIAGAIAQAISDAGCHARYCGRVPIPALAAYALGHTAPAIMVTGSHIPSDRNGIKFYGPTGEVLKSDEPLIFQAVAETRQRIYAEPAETAAFDEAGRLRRPLLLDHQPLEQIVLQAYRQRYTTFFAPAALQGKTVVVYQHSSVGRDFLVDVLQELGATTIPVGRSERFIPIDTENVTPKDQAYFLELAREYPHAFAIVSMDGDADRPFVIDEAGRFQRGDIVGCLVADYLGATHAAVPISASDAVPPFLDQHHIHLTQTKIGSPYVIAAMQNHSGHTSVSWEVNGGFLTADRITKGRDALAPLPTRDAMLPILTILVMAAEQGCTVSQLFSVLPPRFTGAGLMNVPSESSRKLLAFLGTKPGQHRISQLQLGEVQHSNDLDGLRLSFTNGDIVHLRPSGNAPQLRVYSVAASQQRADTLVAEAIAPDGWLPQLLKER